MGLPLTTLLLLPTASSAAASPGLTGLSSAGFPAGSSTGPAGSLGGYFGTAIAGGYLNQTEQTVFEHSVSASATHGVLTHWWLTAHDRDGISTYTHYAMLRIYIDGEANASLAFTPSLAIGVGFGDPAGPWATSLFGRGSAAGAWFSNLRVPFTSSIRITLQQAIGRPDYRNSRDCLWDLRCAGQMTSEMFVRTGLFFICRGAENLGIEIGGVPVPLPGSRLRLQTREQRLAPLEFLTVASLPRGSKGLVLMHTLAFSANSSASDGAGEHRLDVSRTCLAA